MYRLVPIKCGSCGLPASHHLESVPSYICYQCVRTALDWMILNHCTRNPIFHDLVTGIGESQIDGTYRFWRSSPNGGSTDYFYHPDSGSITTAYEHNTGVKLVESVNYSADALDFLDDL